MKEIRVEEEDKKIKNWEVGNYIIEVEANDKYDQKVEDKTQFDVFNSKKPLLEINSSTRPE